MKPLLILAKSLIAGYARRDGVYVKPHSDKRTKRAKTDSDQLVLFPPPAKKPLPPNRFKGLDPIKSTGDLFEDQMQLPVEPPAKTEPAAPTNPARQKRAAAGGEHGPNGEFYEGGKFIATTDHPKGDKKSKKGTGRKEIEPYKWDHPPEPGMHSIFGASRTFNAIENGKMIVNPSISDHTWNYYYGQEPDGVEAAKARFQKLADRYNAGDRWLHPEEGSE